MLKQIQQTAREERDTLIQQGTTLSTQVEAQNQVVRKLEEKERLLQSSLVAMDKELAMRQQVNDDATTRVDVLLKAYFKEKGSF